jgi:hypothetical protein
MGLQCIAKVALVMTTHAAHGSLISLDAASVALTRGLVALFTRFILAFRALFFWIAITADHKDQPCKQQYG